MTIANRTFPVATGLRRASVWILALALASPALAQTGSATLRGVVLDPQRVAMAGVAVSLEREHTGNFRTAITDTAGSYSFAGVLPGVYVLKVTTQGFKPH